MSLFQSSLSFSCNTYAFTPRTSWLNAFMVYLENSVSSSHNVFLSLESTSFKNWTAQEQIIAIIVKKKTSIGQYFCRNWNFNSYVQCVKCIVTW